VIFALRKPLRNARNWLVAALGLIPLNTGQAGRIISNRSVVLQYQ